MKILLFGKAGQVGWELERSLAMFGDLTVLGHRSEGLCGNFENPEGIAESIRAIKPDVIVNAAARTAVDKIEEEIPLAERVNAETPSVIATEAKKIGALFVHYSTDYVFDGSGKDPWDEEAETGPQNVYGETKLKAEQLIRTSGCKHLIFRTSWVYAAHGRNFAKTMYRLAQERESMSVIADQIGAPTGAELIADVTAHAIRVALEKPEVLGTYHLVASGEVSWHGYASFVLDYCRQLGKTLKVGPDDIKPVPTSDFPTPAMRPLNSRLNTTKIEQAFNIKLPHWQDGVIHMLDEFLERRQ